ncbi:hypothetical protein [Nocardioides sp. SYSU DS0663]|uniref:hypothetical protein n=1 Tax=Nocardioides sp. SYSU DS0663 TaxID=3416445 RepID=UPI003F4B8C47
MELTEETFRALARSAPWRWRTLHLTHETADRAVEAWARRPHDLLVRTADGAVHHEHGWPYGQSPLGPAGLPPRRSPQDVEPVWRADGLVARRPDDWWIEYGDVIWENYRWSAMLDPVELSHHTTVADLRAGEREGRRTWWARVSAEEGYDPRCGCCPLLWSEVSDRDEYATSGRPWSPPADTTYPAAYDVALDVETAVVVSLAPVEGPDRSHTFEVTLHEVDADLDALFDPVLRPPRS